MDYKLIKNLKRIIPKSLGGPENNIYSSIIKKQKHNLLSRISEEIEAKKNPGSRRGFWIGR